MLIHLYHAQSLSFLPEKEVENVILFEQVMQAV